MRYLIPGRKMLWCVKVIWQQLGQLNKHNLYEMIDTEFDKVENKSTDFITKTINLSKHVFSGENNQDF